MELMEKPRWLVVLAAKERQGCGSPVHFSIYQLNYISRFSGRTREKLLVS
jgi:hypothetical protein